MIHPSRRDFLKTAAATATATATALALPMFVHSGAVAAPGPSGANGKIRVGLIGAGTRARWLTRAMSRETDRAEVVAVCDCFLPQVDKLAAEYEGTVQAKPRWTAYQDYEEMYDKEDLDAVIIATPDHVRVRAAILACVRGLDIYAEKPLSFSVPEGRLLVKAVRKHRRVLQVGTQQRSTAINTYACKFVRDGGLGKVHTVLVKNMPGARPVPDLPQQEIPQGMDWNRFCAQSPRLDYHSSLYQNWRRWTPFTGGTICDRGAHAIDMVHLAMGWDNVAPVRLEPLAAAENNWERGVRLRYPDGTIVRLESKDGPEFGGILIGEQGKIEINRGRFACNPKDLLAPYAGGDTEDHVANWLDCIQSRAEPNAPVEVGHLVSSVAHLINICRVVGRPINWDAAKEQITQDEEANQLLTKACRPEFSLPAV